MVAKGGFKLINNKANKVLKENDKKSPLNNSKYSQQKF